MNRSAEKHLEKAASYLDRGDDWYVKAANEIVAAREADPKLTHKEIGKWFGHGETWSQKLVAWSASGSPGDAPFGSKTAEQKGRGVVEVKRVLKQATPDEIHSMLADLPIKKVKAVMDAAEEVHTQLHPATAIKGPGNTIPAYRRGFPFLLEMGRASARLVQSIDEYVDKWDEHAKNATEEELQVERDLVAPKLQRLRMTVEEVNV